MKNPTKNLSASTQLKLGAKAVKTPNQVRKNDDQNIIGLLPYLSAINPQNADESIIPKNKEKNRLSSRISCLMSKSQFLSLQIHQNLISRKFWQVKKS